MSLSAAELRHPSWDAAPGAQDDVEQLLNSTIVIVDDESTTMDVVRTFLEAEGYHNFVLVNDSSQAMATIEKKRPDLLLLDLHMPDVSGFDLLKAVRGHAKLSHLPVIILTSSSNNSDKLQALDLGATDFLAKPVDPSELRLRVRNTLAAKAYLDHLAYYNPQTKLPNRHLFMECLEWGLDTARRNSANLALLSIELDQFDKISDSLGLYAGDDILRQLTQRFKKVVQGIDLLGRSTDNDYVPVNLFHLGGGVFTLLLHHIARERDAAMVAECILEAVRSFSRVDNTEVYLTASIGISTYPTEDGDGVTMLQLSSSTRDYVKSRGGDAFQFSSRRINTQYRRRLSIEARLRRALDRDELLLHYQPQLDVRTNRITGVEALLRWRVNARTMVPPDRFVPIAEETGLIIPLGEWVLNQACRQLSEWQQGGMAPVRMAVNLSPAQLQCKEILSVFKRIIDHNGICADLLTLEVTESMLLDNIDGKINTLLDLKDLGLKLAIDDFGTGYSSLSYLKKLPLDELKIDRSFLTHLREDAKGRALVAGLIHMSRNMGLSTLAEGVENDLQLRFLQITGCDHYQGELFSPPVPPDMLPMMLSPMN